MSKSLQRRLTETTRGLCFIYNLLQLPDLNHGADRNRTDGLRLAKAALSQLSYSPVSFPWWA